MTVGDRLRRFAGTGQRARHHGGELNVIQPGGEPLDLGAAARVQRRTLGRSGDVVIDRIGVAVSNEEDCGHEAGSEAGSQWAAKASTSRNVASKSPRKQTARSSSEHVGGRLAVGDLVNQRDQIVSLDPIPDVGSEARCEDDDAVVPLPQGS